MGYTYIVGVVIVDSMYTMNRHALLAHSSLGFGSLWKTVLCYYRHVKGITVMSTQSECFTVII